MDASAIKALLKRAQLKSTPVRTTVLELLASQDVARSANELEVAAAADRITLYRTLKSFEEKGLIHRVKEPDGQLKYAFCGTSCSAKEHNDEHAHFSCTSCGTTSCLPDAKVQELVLPKGYTIATIHLTLAGSCPACSQSIQS